MEKYEEITKELTQQELNLVEPLKRCSDGKAFQIEGTNTTVPYCSYGIYDGKAFQIEGTNIENFRKWSEERDRKAFQIEGTNTAADIFDMPALDGKAFQIEGTNTQRTMKILQLLQFIYALGKTGEKLEK